MNQIHNSISLLATRKPNDNKIYFDADKLRGKKINSIRIFSSTQDKTILSPFKYEMLAQLEELDEKAMFLSIVDTTGKPIIKELPADYFTLDTENLTDLFPIEINNFINWDESALTIKSSPWADIHSEFTFLIIVFYQKSCNKAYSLKDEIQGSVSITYKPTADYEDIQLSKIIDRTLKGRRINQILADRDSMGYLTLFTDKGVFENVPLILFFYRGIDQLYFDNIIIDFDRSYLKVRDFNSTPITITFIY